MIVYKCYNKLYFIVLYNTFVLHTNKCYTSYTLTKKNILLQNVK